MNLIEAIKSGRPFKRKDQHMKWMCLGKFQLEGADDGLKYDPFVCGDILADDWEIQEPAVTITKTQFWDAFESEYGFVTGNEFLRIAMKQIANKLGLED